MTDPEIKEACDKWIASDEIQVALFQVASLTTRANLEKWLRFAFEAGMKARENKALWPDSAVEADKQNMKELGVLWP